MITIHDDDWTFVRVCADLTNWLASEAEEDEWMMQRDFLSPWMTLLFLHSPILCFIFSLSLVQPTLFSPPLIAPLSLLPSALSSPLFLSPSPLTHTHSSLFQVLPLALVSPPSFSLALPFCTWALLHFPVLLVPDWWQACPLQIWSHGLRRPALCNDDDYYDNDDDDIMRKWWRCDGLWW